MRISLNSRFFFIGAVLLSYGAHADLATCEQAIQDFAKYKAAWGTRIDQAASNPANCQSVGRDAQAQVPPVPADCKTVTVGEVPGDFQSLLISLLNDGAGISANASVSALLAKASSETNYLFDLKCTSAARSASGGSRSGPATSPPSGGGNAGASQSGRAL